MVLEFARALPVGRVEAASFVRAHDVASIALSHSIMRTGCHVPFNGYEPRIGFRSGGGPHIEPSAFTTTHDPAPTRSWSGHNLPLLIEQTLDDKGWEQARTKFIGEAERIDTQLRALEKRARELYAQRGVGFKKEIWENGGAGSDRLRERIDGVPPNIKLVIVGGDQYRTPTDPADTLVMSGDAVFRYYLHRSAAGNDIVTSDVVSPGTRAFMDDYVFERSSRFYVREGYSMLAGAFLTMPDYRPMGMDLNEERASYVDMMFHAGTVLLNFYKWFIVPHVSDSTELPVLVVGSGVKDWTQKVEKRSGSSDYKKLAGSDYF